MLKHLSDLLAEHPTYRPSWHDAPGDVVLTNPPFGKILHTVQCGLDDRPLYDLPVWAEPVGAICVALDECGRFAVLEHQRPVVLEAGAICRYPEVNLAQHGRLSLELPRGFASYGEPPEVTARREVEEETGRRVAHVQYLGESNNNTTYFLFNTQVFLVHLTADAAEGVAQDPHESIRRVRYLSLAEVMDCVASGEMICGMSKSAILMYLARKSGGNCCSH